MTVYVDKTENAFRGMIMCHMLADTLAELHEMDRSLGMWREWVQPVLSPHYDSSKTRREAAVKAGVVKLDRREVGASIKRPHKNWGVERVCCMGFQPNEVWPS
jgi:hypothetical protein